MIPAARLSLTKLYMGCEYQGLICPTNLKPLGYEALARFKTEQGEALPPNLVFEWLHEHPALFEQVEFKAKCFQLDNAPQGLPLFLNLDPHAIAANTCAPLVEKFKHHPDLTIELIENTCINDATLALDLLKKLSKLNIKSALDDVGAPHSMLSLELLSQVHCVKFDKAWLVNKNANAVEDKSELDLDRKSLLASLIAYAKQTGKLTILEGVETSAQLALAQELGIDRVQGFLFKQAFIQTPITTEIQLPITSNQSNKNQFMTY